MAEPVRFSLANALHRFKNLPTAPLPPEVSGVCGLCVSCVWGPCGVRHTRPIPPFPKPRLPPNPQRNNQIANFHSWTEAEVGRGVGHVAEALQYVHYVKRR